MWKFKNTEKPTEQSKKEERAWREISDMIKETGLPKAFWVYVLVSNQSHLSVLPLCKLVYSPLLGNKAAFTGTPVCKEVALRSESLSPNTIPAMY